jgi:hypothetical protein
METRPVHVEFQDTMVKSLILLAIAGDQLLFGTASHVQFGTGSESIAEYVRAR